MSADIDEELDRISRIVRSLLDFSRSATPHPERTNLNQVLETLVRVIQPCLSRQQVVLHLGFNSRWRYPRRPRGYATA